MRKMYLFISVLKVLDFACFFVAALLLAWIVPIWPSGIDGLNVTKTVVLRGFWSFSLELQFLK